MLSCNQADKVEGNMLNNSISFSPDLQQYIIKVKNNFSSINEERKKQLLELSNYLKNDNSSKLTFICTHNSRRSHMAQIWAATAAAYYGLKNVETYSGGTESTAFNPRAVAAIERAGFNIQKGPGENPKYQVSFHNSAKPMICFSKKYDDDFNPSENFVAIMTCSQADEACPYVAGAKQRFSIPYEDPKVADNTPKEKAKYDERCLQIATEMFFVFDNVN